MRASERAGPRDPSHAARLLHPFSTTSCSIASSGDLAASTALGAHTASFATTTPHKKPLWKHKTISSSAMI